ncbi:MAG: N4-gp56 family major capsid protein [Ruminococcaceae bacterium]|nr:N4-gp56 family major capsid protein [Oscillospiraceae bacterium]
MELVFDIQAFANANVQTTAANESGNDLSPAMKEYYDTELLENAKEELFFNQFGKVQSLPEGNGKKVEWRKFDTFGKATTPLEEGVTPDGNTMNMKSVEAQVEQYGDYTTVSDMLDLTAVDDVILSCTEEHGTQAGLTLDTLTRNEICKGTNVSFAPRNVDGVEVPVSLRYELDSSAKLTSTVVNKAVTKLKKNKTPKINGKYIAIIHPSVSEDLRESEGWIEAHKYAAVTEIFNGEIGELHGVRFIESNEAPIFKGGDLIPGVTRNLTVSSDVSSSYTITVGTIEGLSSVVNRYVLINGEKYKVTGFNGTNKIILDAAVTLKSGDNIYPGEGGAKGCAVYGCIFFGRDAYGRVELSGGAMEMIVKSKGSAGTADPLNQRSTVGWKAAHAAAILYEERLLRVECGSSYSETDEAN